MTINKFQGKTKEEAIENAKKELAHTQIEEFMKKMNQLGLSKEETITLIQNSKEGDS